MLTNDGYCIEKEGLAMGSPLLALLANVWLTQFDERCKTMKSKWYYRNVDDVFMTLREDVIESTLEIINGWKNHLSLTYEEENDTGKFNFLDITIMRCSDSKIETT